MYNKKMSDILQIVNQTCTLLLNRSQDKLVWGLEPSLVLQSVSVFISFVISCKIFSVNLFRFFKSKEEVRKLQREERKRNRLQGVVLSVLDQQRNLATSASGEESNQDLPPFQRRI